MSKYIIHKGQKYVRVDGAGEDFFKKNPKQVEQYLKSLDNAIRNAREIVSIGEKKAKKINDTVKYAKEVLQEAKSLKNSKNYDKIFDFVQSNIIVVSDRFNEKSWF